jgi:two-component system, cell cycle sensor histidine kinase and response regulator CckA
MKAPLPPDEAQRLKTLHQYDVLDTPPEQSFDDLTLLAAHICQTPMATVSLVDKSRQWFKSKIGVTAEETSRDIAFCAHTILHKDEVLEVRDAEADPRFADSPLVTTDPHIRFYAGAPLVAPDGQALGALCVMDRAPRTLTPEQLAALGALSRHVVAQLELRRQARELAANKAEADRLLGLAEKSRRAVLSVLEDEKRAGQNLRESEERFRQLAETIQEVFWITCPARNQMIYVSPAYEKIWGRTCKSLYASPQSWLDAIHPEDRDRIRQAVITRQPNGTYDEEYRILRPDQSVRWIHDRAFPVRDQAGQVDRIVGVAGDITEKKKMEAQFLRAQRLENIGTLAGGIAHDLNNVLAPILMSCEMLQMQARDEITRNLVVMIKGGAERGADLVRQVLSFARGVEGRRIAVQARHLIREMVNIARETFPKSIRIESHVQKDLWIVSGDPTQLHQVLLNLCVNARDAMPTGGELTITADNVSVETLRPGRDQDIKPGPYLVIKVTDTGTGIPPEIRERIFEPFFTTKEVGKGTGLGLSTTLGIVKSHGGIINIDSEPGKGTTFEIWLPAQDCGEQTAAPVGETRLPRGNGEQVLVVDDELSLRTLTRQTLEAHGYAVLTASNGAEAITIYSKHKDEIDVVLTDILMPEMDGVTLTLALRKMNPDALVIATCGFADKEHHSKAIGAGAKKFLAKPYTAETLLNSLAEMLHQSAECVAV